MTQKELAKLLNVSRATVSLALVDSNKVNPDTRRRVQSLAKKLNYQPNRASRMLSTKKSQTIGIMIPSFRNQFYGELSEEIFECLHRHDYSALFSFDINRRHYLDALNDMVSRGVDGILTSPYTRYFSRLLELQAGGLPVLVFNTTSNCPLDHIGPDNFQCGYMATKHLLDNGRKNIACICYFEDQRYDGYRAALREHGLEPDPDLMYNINADLENGFLSMNSIIEKHSNKLPDAVYCHNDIAAMGAMRAAQAAGFRIPEDIAFVGRDNLDLSQYFNPPLTSIVIDRKVMAEKAVDIMLEKLSGKSADKKYSISLEPELIVRESCGAKVNMRKNTINYN